MDWSTIIQMIIAVIKDVTGHQWGLLMVLVSGWVVQLLTQDSKFPISLPASWNTNVWKPVAVVLASETQAVVWSVVHDHVAVWVAVVTGFKVAMSTLGLWSLVIKAIYDGKPPEWMNELALIFPPSDK